MNNIIISALDEQFNKDCKVISTNSEYPSYTGIEKWIIITDLTEEELNSKYSEQVNPLRPFIILSRSFGKVRNKYIRNENKHRRAISDKNGKPLRPTLKPKDVKRKSSSNKSQVLLLFLKQRP